MSLRFEQRNAALRQVVLLCFLSSCTLCGRPERKQETCSSDNPRERCVWLVESGSSGSNEGWESCVSILEESFLRLNVVHEGGESKRLQSIGQSN